MGEQSRLSTWPDVNVLSVGSDTHGQADKPVLVLSEVFYIMGLPAQCNNK
jgi:hypothetical protein